MARWIASRSRIEDDRGERHVVRRLEIEGRASFRVIGTSFRVLDEQEQATPAERAVALGRRVLKREGERSAEQVTLITLIAADVVIFGLLACRGFRSGWSPVPLIACILVGLMLVAVVQSERRRDRRDKSALTNLPPVCLACGYQLSGVPRDDDGCTVCPECGAAWRLPVPGPGPGS